MNTLSPEQMEQLKQRTIKIVRENARMQNNEANRTNYFNSCVKHGNMLAEVAEEIKKEF